MMFMTRFLILLTLLLAGTTAAMAAAPSKDAGQKPLGTFGVWRTYSYTDGGNPVCYMVKEGQFPANKKFKRGASYLMITQRPGENSRDVVSYSAGYNYKPASDVTAVVGKTSFDLFTDKTTAWSRDAKTDHALATAIAGGTTMKMTGSPASGPMGSVTDSLDLKGSTQAYQAIGVACGLIKPAAKAAPAKPASAAKKTHK